MARSALTVRLLDAHDVDAVIDTSVLQHDKERQSGDWQKAETQFVVCVVSGLPPCLISNVKKNDVEYDGWANFNFIIRLARLMRGRARLNVKGELQKT